MAGAVMNGLDEATKGIFEKYPVFEPAERGKVRCVVTGHELPPKFELLDAYVRTSKFIRAFKISEIMDEYGEYFDDLGNNKFGCKLTKRIVAKDPDDLKRHVEGKKFKVALEKAELNEDEDVRESCDSDMSVGDESLFPQRVEDSTFDDEDDDEDEEEYPEFVDGGRNGVSDSDNNDFSAMDTEDSDLKNRKRKAASKAKHKKKKRK